VPFATGVFEVAMVVNEVWPRARVQYDRLMSVAVPEMVSGSPDKIVCASVGDVITATGAVRSTMAGELGEVAEAPPAARVA